MNLQRRMTIWIILVTAFMANAATQSPVKTDSVPARKLMATDTAAPADSSARKFASGVLEGATASNILICTVYGDLWNPKKASMDAVTGPTKTIKPMVIAGKIMQRLDTVFSRMPTSGKAGR